PRPAHAPVILGDNSSFGSAAPAVIPPTRDGLGFDTRDGPGLTFAAQLDESYRHTARYTRRIFSRKTRRDLHCVREIRESESGRTSSGVLRPCRSALVYAAAARA